MGCDLVAFGEAMIRLVPPRHARLEQAVTVDVTVGGSELNVAVSAARLGLSASYVTRLPRNPLGRMIINKAREQGVRVAEALWTDEGRVGIYFVEFGASPRANSVLYDRQGSTMAQLRPGEIDWEKVLSGTRVFHTTGITAALSSTCREATQEAVREAKRLGVLVSIDLNYRARLWSPEAARSVMEKLIGEADILITTEEDIERVLGLCASSYEEVAEQLAQRFDLKAVAITLRESESVWRNRWSAIAVADGNLYRAPQFDLEIVDRVGAGDSFAGGFLAGYLSGGPEEGVRTGVAISALKQTNPGDFCWATREEVDRILAGGGLRILR